MINTSVGDNHSVSNSERGSAHLIHLVKLFFFAASRTSCGKFSRSNHVKQDLARVEVPGDPADDAGRQVLRAARPAVPATLDPVEYHRQAACARASQ
jgi:hypothetical protein